MFERTPVEERGHVQRLTERPLFLKGHVHMVLAGPMKKLTDAQLMLAKAAAMEHESAATYHQAAIEHGQSAEGASMQIFEKLVDNEARHFDQFEKRLKSINWFGPTHSRRSRRRNAYSAFRRGGCSTQSRGSSWRPVSARFPPRRPADHL